MTGSFSRGEIRVCQLVSALKQLEPDLYWLAHHLIDAVLPMHDEEGRCVHLEFTASRAEIPSGRLRC